MPGETIIEGHYGLRAKISEDGAIHDCKGVLIGFINEDGSAGDQNEKFLGEVNQDGTVLDVDDSIVGYVDLGKGTLRDKGGSHYATIQSDGTILDKHEGQRGKISNFSYTKLRLFASYVFFFDTLLIEEHGHTKLTSNGIDAVDTSSLGHFADADSVDKEEARLMRHVTKAKATAPVAKPSSHVKPEPAKPVAKPEPIQPKPITEIGPVVDVPKSSAEPVTDEHGLLASAEEKARKEAERMNRMMGGMSIPTTSSNQHQVSQHSLVSTQYPVPARPEVKSKYEVEVWNEINRARQHPAEFVSKLEAMKANFKGKDYHYPGTHTIRPTNEGVAAVEKAIEFLKQQKPLSTLTLSDGLSNSCKDLVARASETTNFDALESDSESTERLVRYGEWSGHMFQNLALGNLPPVEVVINWIIDDGNTRRDHRHSIFNEGVKIVGIASGPHIQFSRSVVACFTSNFQEKQGTNTNTTQASPRAVAHSDDIPSVSTETEYKVGPLSDTGDKYFLDISNLGCPVNGLHVKLLENGKILSMSRIIRVNDVVKEAVQKLKLPFAFKQSQVTAVYSESVGVLTLNFAKASSSSGGSPQSINVGEFTVPAWASNTNDKVNVTATASGDAYVFVCEPSKYETKVKVHMDADRKLTFDMQYKFDTVVEGEPATKTVKMSSAFGIPFEVSPEQISILPNGDKGSQVRVLKTKPSDAPHVQPDVTISITRQ